MTPEEATRIIESDLINKSQLAKKMYTSVRPAEMLNAKLKGINRNRITEKDAEKIKAIIEQEFKVKFLK